MTTAAPGGLTSSSSSSPSTHWVSFQFQIPMQDLLEGVRTILETLVIFLEILKTLLETVKILLILFANAIIALVNALITLILNFFLALLRTGLYGWFHVPKPSIDPSFRRHTGGSQAFFNKFKGSLINVRDPNRPQPIAGFTQSGFILFVVDADGIVQMVRLILAILRFFGQDHLQATFRAPTNFKVLPVGPNGDPIISVVTVFQKKPTELVLQWGLPSNQIKGTPGFQDVIASLADEFVPPNFLIEKSEINPNAPIDASQLTNPQAAGLVTTTIKTNFEQNGQPGKTVQKVIKLQDYYFNPFIKFQKYISIDPSQNLGSFILGQLGTFRYIDTDVQPGKSYWYRVRAYNGDLTINPDNTMSFQAPVVDPITNRTYVVWPSSSPPPGGMVGKPSPIIAARVPLYPTFDVIANLKALFQAAFSLNFHQPLPQGSTFGSDGAPTGTTSVTTVGLGSMTQLAGALASFQANPILGAAAGAGAVPAQVFVPNPATNQLPTPPWQVSSVVRNSTRLTIIVSQALLQTGNALALEQFFLGPFKKQSPTSVGASNLSQLVTSLTPTSTDPTAMQQAQQQYGNAYVDLGVRLNVLAGIQYVKTFLLSASPPDWIEISLLRDLLPWAGQLLYELIAKIQALLAAFQGLIQEIINFINAIERKINVLEQFIEYIISILNLLLSFQIGAYILLLPATGGDVTDWFAAIDNAGGTPPSSGPDGFTAGICLGFIAPDIGGILSALGLIF